MAQVELWKHIHDSAAEKSEDKTWVTFCKHTSLGFVESGKSDVIFLNSQNLPTKRQSIVPSSGASNVNLRS